MNIKMKRKSTNHGHESLNPTGEWNMQTKRTSVVDYVLIVRWHLKYKRDGSTLFTEWTIKKSCIGEVVPEVSLKGRLRVFPEEG